MSLLLSRGIPRVALFLGLRRFPGTIRYREAGPTVVLTGRRPYREDAKKSPTRGEQQQPQGNNNKNNGHLYPTIPFRTDPGECSATGNLRVLRGKNRPPGLVDGRVSGRQAFCCTTENTEVTEALGSSPLTRPPCGSDSTFLFLVYDDQGFAALPCRSRSLRIETAFTATTRREQLQGSGSPRSGFPLLSCRRGRRLWALRWLSRRRSEARHRAERRLVRGDGLPCDGAADRPASPVLLRVRSPLPQQLSSGVTPRRESIARCHR